jgi:sodium-dependent dicarboxylate transporter 2/3/5
MPRSAQLLRLSIALVAGIIVTLALSATGLTPAGRRMAGLFVAVLVLWAGEVLPVAVTALLALALQPILGIATVRATWTSFISPVFFFVLAMYLLAAAIHSSGVDRRFTLWLLSRAGTEPRRVLWALMAGCAAFSTVMSDLVVCTVFTAVAAGVLDRAKILPGSSFGKAVMIGIPIASFIGGVATPAGSTVNVLGIQFIEEYGKFRVPFLSWTAIGIPMVVVLLPVAYWAILRASPPELSAVGDGRDVARERAEMGPLSLNEKKILGIFSVLIVLWIASTWVPAFDLALVALAGSIALFLPGIGFLTWREAEKSVGWDSLIMIGGVTSLGAASVSTGLAKWMVDVALGGLASLNPVWIIAAVSAFTVVIHFVIPIAPVINSVLIPPIVLLAISSGHNPALYAIPVAFTASCAFLLPIDAVSLVTFSRGYYRMLDMLRPGVIVSIVWVIWMTILLMLLGPRLGFL